MRAALLSALLGFCLFPLSPAYSASVDDIVSAKKAAAAALNIVQDTLRDTAYVGPRLPGSGPRSGPHWGMFDLLQNLNRAARAISDDDGKNPESIKEKEVVFSNALERAIKNADAIASRADEREVIFVTPEEITCLPSRASLLPGLLASRSFYLTIAAR